MEFLQIKQKIEGNKIETGSSSFEYCYTMVQKFLKLFNETDSGNFCDQKPLQAIKLNYNYTQYKFKQL